MRILPNLKRHSINFPHQIATDGVIRQTKAAKTVVRVGYAHSTRPARAMRVAMSLHDDFGEITADRVTTNGKPLYKSPVGALELRSDVPVLPEDESDGGVARAACVAEATFEFTFNVTETADIDCGTKPRVPVPWSREGHADFPKPRREQAAALVRAGASLCLATSNPSAFRNAWNEFMMETYLPAEIQPMAAQVRLRFAVEDAPNLCVATTPFRLVARKDPALLEQS